MKHNNVLPNQHFRKDWSLHVRTWFNQPGQKKARRVTRSAKASKVAPRPLDSLRPAVRCPTLKYQTKLRAGRGFTLAELKAAGIRSKEALSIGIAVDHRRKNRSVEGLEANVLRLKEYKAKLILFPKKANKPKKGDADATARSSLPPQIKAKSVLPIAQSTPVVEMRQMSGTPTEGAFHSLRMARSNARLAGIREARAKAKAEEEKAKK